ncbi:hypothetical protein LI951_06600 [Enterococcus sp. BWT-B8]|uniref:hypothetical protein n=1 Tax=Enterococcus sp. BWT-B8 TaxID=2885157 RepID=UPI001E5A8137|nr:hypothetical protein [Enterococcus sp. BWT-B8]MCB5951730.1 hypothetical protein [Enterococcus sp. BWT-B8]
MQHSTPLSKTIARQFLAFLSMVFLFGFLILLSLYLTLFSGKYLERQAEKSDYYTNLSEEINKQIENTALGSNIPAGVLEIAVTEAFVKEDVKSYLTAMYNRGKDFELKNQKNVHNSVTEKIKRYATDKGIDVTKDTENSILLLADRSVEIYDGYIELPFLVSFTNRMIGYKSKLLLFMIVCGILWAILSAVLFSSLRGYFHRLVRFWGYIFTGGGLMMIVLPAFFLLTGVLKRLGIQSKAMYGFVQTYLASFLQMFIVMGIISVAIGVFFALFSEFQRKRMLRQ